jgi:hypothetical protein
MKLGGFAGDDDASRAPEQMMLSPIQRQRRAHLSMHRTIPFRPHVSKFPFTPRTHANALSETAGLTLGLEKAEDVVLAN